MVNGSIIFKGFSEKEKVRKIFEILGTPTEKTYPMYMEYSGWKEDNWEVYYGKNLKEVLPTLDDNGIDLLKKLLELDPEKRILSTEALEHPFFKDLDEETKKMYE